MQLGGGAVVDAVAQRDRAVEVSGWSEGPPGGGITSDGALVGVAEGQARDRESVPINVGKAIEELRCCEDKRCVFLDVGELNGGSREEFRSVVNGCNGEGLGGKGFAAIWVSNDVVECDGAVEVVFWGEGVITCSIVSDGARVGGEAFYRESRGEGFNV